MIHSNRRAPSAAAVLSLACLALVVACGSSSTGSPPSPAVSASTATASPGSVAKNLPTSCSDIPTSLISTYTGGTAAARSLAAPPRLSCEFANANASTIVIINIGQGTPALFATLRSSSAGGGRTVTSISGLGVAAFSITKSGKPGGVDALSDQNGLFSVASNLPIARDVDLIRQLMDLF